MKREVTAWAEKSRPIDVTVHDEASQADPGPLQAELRNRHRDFYVNLAEGAAEAWDRESEHWLPILAKEQGNLRAALEWSLRRNDRDSALRLCTALAPFWCNRRLFSEADAAFSAALEIDGPESVTSARALAAHGEVLWEAGRYWDAVGVLEEARHWLVTVEDRAGLGKVLALLAWNHHYAGEGELATSFAQQAVDLLHAGRLCRELLDALRALGWRQAAEGDVKGARETYVEALRVAEELGADAAAADTWGVYANFLRTIGAAEESEEANAQAAQKYERLGRTADQAEEFRRLARSLRERGQTQQAEGASRRAAELAQMAGAEGVLAWMAIDGATAALKAGELEMARREGEAAMAHFRRLPELSNEDAWAVHDLMSQLAEVAYAEGRIVDGRAAVNEATRAAALAAAQAKGAHLMLALTGAATAAEEHGDRDGSRHALTIVLPMLAERPDAAAVISWVRARMAKLDGRADEAHRLLQEAVSHSRSDQDRHFESLMLFEMAVVDRTRGAFGAARAELDECRALVEDLGNKPSAPARIYLELARLARLEERWEDVAESDRELRSRSGHLPPLARCEAAEHLAASASYSRNDEAAVRLLAAASAWRDRHAKPRPDPIASEAQTLLSDARARLDGASFARAWAEGTASPLEDLIRPR